jgi:hypothetical protein
LWFKFEMLKSIILICYLNFGSIFAMLKLLIRSYILNCLYYIFIFFFFTATFFFAQEVNKLDSQGKKRWCLKRIYAESKDRVTKELLIMVKKLDFSNFFDDTKQEL